MAIIRILSWLLEVFQTIVMKQDTNPGLNREFTLLVQQILENLFSYGTNIS